MIVRVGGIEREKKIADAFKAYNLYIRIRSLGLTCRHSL